MTIFVQQKRNSAILWSVKEAFRADMVTLRWEGNTLLLKALLLDGKQLAVRVSRLYTFAFWGCAGMHSTLLTGLSAAGLFGGCSR